MKLKTRDVVALREVRASDLPALYRFQADRQSNRMVGFVPRTRPAFYKHWRKILADRTLEKKVILRKGFVAGYLVCFIRTPPQREVGYWIARKHWGKGVATAALALFLKEYDKRPLYARISKTNIGSLKVSKRCGFKVCGKDAFTNPAGVKVVGYVLKLRGRGGKRS